MKQITEKVFQISLGAVNVFIIEDNGLTLIDTGLKGSTDKIFKAIKKAGRDPHDIKRIILTHCHPDHTGSAAELKAILKVPVYAHPEDALIIEDGIGGGKADLTPGIINWLIYHLFIKKAGYAIPAVSIDQKLNDHDIIDGNIEVIHTPGHTSGHICLLVRDQHVLIAADICANMGGLAYSTLYEDIKEGQKSILKAAAFDFDKAVFGHGGPILKNAAGRLYNKFNIFAV
jgi:glyoxylase-like metal-dependent hydrolase (beta-lactamase superfamily II)